MTALDPTDHPFDPIRAVADDMEAERRARAQDRARTLLALADRVCAEEPSQELDADIWDTIGLTPIQEEFARDWCSQNGRTDLTRRLYLLAWSRAFTTSLDAAASAMPAGWRIWMIDQSDTGFAVTLHGPLIIGSLIVSAEAPTEPRARTAAALRAMAAGEDIE